MSEKLKSLPMEWQSQKDGFQDSLHYLKGRMNGEIKSLKTPWAKFNDAMTDGIEWNTMTVIGGRPACLSGDSKMYIARKGTDGSGRWYSLKDIYYKFNGLRHTDMSFRDRGWNNTITTNTQCYKYDENLTGLNQIKAVYESGIKPVYLVTTEAGKTIKTTLDHRFLVDFCDDFKELKDLDIGDFIVCKAEPKKKDKAEKIIYKRVYIMKKMAHYPSAKIKRTGKYIYHRISEARAVYDAYLNNLELAEFIDKVNLPNTFVFSNMSMEIHHKDQNPLNNDISNLQLLSVKDHHALHNDRSRLGLNHVQKEKIASIDYIGDEMTYDVSMKDPYNNFIANEFVVHNSGKTLIAEQITRESFKLNAGENFRVLQFQFEMLARSSAIREYSSIIGRSYKYLCSADGVLSDDDLKKCYEYAKEKIKHPIDVVEKPCTIDDFRRIIHNYMEMHSEITDKGKVFTKTLITIDHSLLFKKAAYEKEKHDTLNNLGEALTELKRIYPIAFIVLSQLNRNIDHPDRAEDGKYGNYVLESDIFGADALLQHADTVIGINRPGKQKIRFYGPDRFIIEDDRVMVLHFLKCRNGDTRLSFFRAEFEKMRIVEMNTPPQQEKRIGTK